MISEIDMDVNIWKNLDELIHNLRAVVRVKEDTYLISLNKVRMYYKDVAPNPLWRCFSPSFMKFITLTPKRSTLSHSG